MADLQWTLTDRRAAVEAIMRLGEGDLRYLNRVIVDRLKLIAQARSTVEMARFNVGDRVCFQAKCGHWVTGVVQRLNKKTVSVVSDQGQGWNVSPSLLTLASDLPRSR